MLRGTTGRQESRTDVEGDHWRTVRGVDVDLLLQVDSDAAGLTGHLPQAADEQRLVVPPSKGDAVAASVLLQVLDQMFMVGVRHTQEVFLQQLRAAQDRTVVGEGRHEPERHTPGFTPQRPLRVRPLLSSGEFQLNQTGSDSLSR